MCLQLQIIEIEQTTLTVQKDDNKWQQFVEGEVIVKQGFVNKRKGLFARKRMLLLTTGPRLFYIDPVQMVKKGEIPMSRDLRSEPKNFKIFFVHTVSEIYVFPCAFKSKYIIQNMQQPQQQDTVLNHLIKCFFFYFFFVSFEILNSRIEHTIWRIQKAMHWNGVGRSKACVKNTSANHHNLKLCKEIFIFKKQEKRKNQNERIITK